MASTFRSCILLIAISAAAGCSGSDGPVGPNGDSPMRATIDGQQWSAATTPGATIAMRLTGSNTLSVTGTDPALRSVNLTIGGVTGPGTYVLPATGPALGLVSHGSATWFSSMPGGGGSVTITTMNAERVAGTFEFTAMVGGGSPTNATVRVTNGQFNLEWTGDSGF